MNLELQRLEKIEKITGEIKQVLKNNRATFSEAYCAIESVQTKIKFDVNEEILKVAKGETTDVKSATYL